MNRFFGDRAFYRRVLAIAIPIIIQNGITNFVSLLDNIMVGQIGTIPMSGVSIVNGLLFVFNLCIFGASSGAGIFTAQFHGCSDQEGIRHTFRFKFLVCLLLSTVGVLTFLLGGQLLIGLYLTGEGDSATAAGAMGYGLEYLAVMLWGLLPFALCNTYSSTLRETGETVVPMVGGIAAVLVNLVLNYILIFGHFGAPAMGVRGAALATVFSRYVELAIVAGWTHSHPEKKPFIVGAYRSFYVPGKLLKAIMVKGMPLLGNEFLWSTGIALLNQCYSTCGLDVVPAMNISSTLYNLGSVAFLAMGISVGIIMGQMLGAGNSKEAVKDANRKLLVTALMCGVIFGFFLLGVSWMFPMLYNTTPAIRQLGGDLIRIIAVLMPVNAYVLACYFTLRAGGQALVTFLFDSCFMWVCSVALAFCLSRFADLPIIPLYAICQGVEIIKCFIGTWLLKKDFWIKNLAGG